MKDEGEARVSVLDVVWKLSGPLDMKQHFSNPSRSTRPAGASPPR